MISKSGEGVAHVAPSEKVSTKEAPKPSEEKKPKVTEESPKAPPPTKEKPQAPSLTTQQSQASVKEPQLPPKDRERRVSFIFLIAF